MIAWAALLLLSASVKTDRTSLRDGCSVDESVIATLPAGTPLTIRFALSGESVPCYKVTAETDGKKFEGYLPASAIDGLEEFDKARKVPRGWMRRNSSARWITPPRFRRSRMRRKARRPTRLACWKPANPPERSKFWKRRCEPNAIRRYSLSPE